MDIWFACMVDWSSSAKRMYNSAWLSQVGMAAQKGTVERLRASGVGALSNAFGMAASLGGAMHWNISYCSPKKADVQRV